MTRRDYRGNFYGTPFEERANGQKYGMPYRRFHTQEDAMAYVESKSNMGTVTYWDDRTCRSVFCCQLSVGRWESFDPMTGQTNYLPLVSCSES